jgi:hypothetical protein
MTADPGDVVTRIVQRVADRTGRDPLDLPPLADAVDPEAVAALVEPGGDRTPTGHPTVTFEDSNYLVTVEAGGTVRVGEARSSDGGTRVAGDD